MKKGSLSLSITAIVVIVIAFVVLGLGLGLTRTIFDNAETQLVSAFEITELEDKPTSQKPITIPETLNVDRNKKTKEKFGFYNTGSTSAKSAKFQFAECKNEDGETIEKEMLPGVVSPSQNVGASDAIGFNVIINEKGLPAGDYICTVGVVCDDTSCPDWTEDIAGGKYYEKKQIFLSVNA